MKIRPVGAELLRSEGQTDRPTDRERRTDMTKLIVAFRDFAEVPKITNTFFYPLTNNVNYI